MILGTQHKDIKMFWVWYPHPSKFHNEFNILNTFFGYWKRIPHYVYASLWNGMEYGGQPSPGKTKFKVSITFYTMLILNDHTKCTRHDKITRILSIFVVFQNNIEENNLIFAFYDRIIIRIYNHIRIHICMFALDSFMHTLMYTFIFICWLFEPIIMPNAGQIRKINIQALEWLWLIIYSVLVFIPYGTGNGNAFVFYSFSIPLCIYFNNFYN